MVLKIGPLAVDPPVVLAPMAGVTNPAFRTLCRRWGPGLYVSEMITARALLERNPRTERMVRRAAGEPVHSVQLYAVDPGVAGAAVRRVVDDIGADHVDFNFGCPAPKVTRRGGGAALPAHPALLGRIVAAAVAAAGAVPVTVKLRLGIDAWHPTAARAAAVAVDAGAAAVTLHARTAEQRYAGDADWSAIGCLAATLPVPVLGNGDIWAPADAVAMMAATGCAGVVVGRGCLGRPWLFAGLAAALSGRPVPAPPRLGTVVDTMVEHAELLCSDLGAELGIRDFRKHVGWYLAGFPVGSAARAELSRSTSVADLVAALGRFDRDIDPPPDAAAIKRGHTDGPRPVALPAGWLDHPDDTTPPTGADGFASGG